MVTTSMKSMKAVPSTAMKKTTTAMKKATVAMKKATVMAMKKVSSSSSSKCHLDGGCQDDVQLYQSCCCWPLECLCVSFQCICGSCSVLTKLRSFVVVFSMLALVMSMLALAGMDHTSVSSCPMMSSVIDAVMGPTYGTRTPSVYLNQCNDGKLDLAELEMKHSHLGFAASELINVARPLEKIFLETEAAHRNNNTKNNATGASCDMPALPTMEFHLNATAIPSFDNLTNFTQALGFTIADGFESLKNVNTANVTNATVTTLNNASEGTAKLVNCAYVKSEQMVDKLYQNTFSAYRNNQELQKALQDRFSSVMAGPRDGPLRFSVNDAVAQMREIFAPCNFPEDLHHKTNQQVAIRYPNATYTEFDAVTASQKLQTHVADGWLIEAYVTNGLWMNVSVSRGSFSLSLNRKSDGLIFATAHGFELGEI